MKTEYRSMLAAVTLAIFTASTVTVQAQFICATNNGTLTILGYNGPGGAITIPDTINGLPVTCIGPMAFSWQPKLTSVTIPPSVTSIETAAFVSCLNLASVTIPDSVTNMGNAAFMLCTSLASIELPSSLLSIGGSAFQECVSLASVIIPHSVTSIGFQAFNQCVSLSAIDVDPLNPAYRSVDGVLFDHSETTLLAYPGGKLGGYTVPIGVIDIGESAFSFCTNLTAVTISPGVIGIGYEAFRACDNLNSVTLPNGLVSIGRGAFDYCTSLTNIGIPASVTSLGQQAFSMCTNLTGIYFQGNAPSLGGAMVFDGDSRAFVYYLSGTSGWGSTYGGRPTVLLDPPTIPLSQTAEVGSAVRWRVETSGPSPLFWLWYQNHTNFILCATNGNLLLTNLQFSQAGGYAAVLTNAGWAVTSSPAILQVIPPVPRRPVPGVQVGGQTGTVMNLDCADELRAAPSWTLAASFNLTNTPQHWFDLTMPLPPQRSYRAWQTGVAGEIPSLGLQMVPAITVAGDVGDTLRLDYINRLGPIDAWVTLGTMTLTNSSQLYFDVSAPAQPERLYRITRVP